MTTSCTRAGGLTRPQFRFLPLLPSHTPPRAAAPAALTVVAVTMTAAGAAGRRLGAGPTTTDTTTAGRHPGTLYCCSAALWTAGQLEVLGSAVGMSNSCLVACCETLLACPLLHPDTLLLLTLSLPAEAR